MTAMKTLSYWRLMIFLTLRYQFGNRFWFAPMIVLIWPLCHIVLLPVGLSLTFDEAQVQNVALGIPLYVSAIVFGVGVIVAESDKKTLEVTYTIPGGARKLWCLKLVSALLLLSVIGLAAAILVRLFYTSYPWSALFGAFRGAGFLLVLAMWLGVLVRNELIAGIICGSLCMLLVHMASSESLAMNVLSPYFEPLSVEALDRARLAARIALNYGVTGLAAIGLMWLAFSEAERREAMLSS